MAGKVKIKRWGELTVKFDEDGIVIEDFDFISEKFGEMGFVSEALGAIITTLRRHQYRAKKWEKGQLKDYPYHKPRWVNYHD